MGVEANFILDTRQRTSPPSPPRKKSSVLIDGAESRSGRVWESIPGHAVHIKHHCDTVPHPIFPWC